MRTIAFVFILTIVYSSCRKDITHYPPSITLTTFHNNIDTGTTWVVDSLELNTYADYNPNYYGPQRGGWSTSYLNKYTPTGQTITFRPNGTYTATNFTAEILGIWKSGDFSLDYLVNADGTTVKDSSGVSFYLSCDLCGSGVAGRIRRAGRIIPDYICIETNYYNNTYTKKFFGRAFIRPR